VPFAALAKDGGERGIRTPGRLLHLQRFSKAPLSTTQPSLRPKQRGKRASLKVQGGFHSQSYRMKPQDARTASNVRLADTSRSSSSRKLLLFSAHISA